MSLGLVAIIFSGVPDTYLNHCDTELSMRIWNHKPFRFFDTIKPSRKEYLPSQWIILSASVLIIILIYRNLGSLLKIVSKFECQTWNSNLQWTLFLLDWIWSVPIRCPELFFCLFFSVDILKRFALTWQQEDMMTKGKKIRNPYLML